MGDGTLLDHAQRMPIASRAAAMVAGILGGSGTHVVQIIIAIVVAAALIVYFLLRVGARGGRGDVRAAAAAVPQHHRAHEGAVSDATVRLVRAWSGIGIGARSEQWNIAIDGIVVGTIANKETVEVDVAPGHHTLRLGSAGTAAWSVRSTSPRTRSSASVATVRGSGHSSWRRW